MKARSTAYHPPVIALAMAIMGLSIGAVNKAVNQTVHSETRFNMQMATNQLGLFSGTSSMQQETIPDLGEPDPSHGETNWEIPQANAQPEQQPSRMFLDFKLPNPFNLFNAPAREALSSTSYQLEVLFEDDSYSLVAKAVGSAEGTRTPTGGYTSAFQGHTDPGNGVWNLGTFSYQHGAASPEEADQKQLQRLQRQATQIRQRAAKQDITLGLEEELNGIDLANQSPLAALGNPGYAEWLAEAYRRGLQGKDAILWARVHGYWDVRRNRWNAPGLGNTEPSIRRDQNRRMQAIARAIEYNAASTFDEHSAGGLLRLEDNGRSQLPSTSPSQLEKEGEEIPNSNFVLDF